MVERGVGRELGVQGKLNAWVFYLKLSKIKKSLKLFFCPHRSYMQTLTFSLEHLMALFINFCNSYASLSWRHQTTCNGPRDMRRVCSVKYISKADSLEGLVLQWRESEKKRKLHRQVEVDMVDEPQRKMCVVDVLSEALTQNIYCEGDTLSTPSWWWTSYLY